MEKWENLGLIETIHGRENIRIIWAIILWVAQALGLRIDRLETTPIQFQIKMRK